MRILHIGLAAHYTNGMTYQDNQLVYQNVLDGHDVLYISDSKQFVDGKLVDCGFQRKKFSDKLEVVWLPYERVFNHLVSDKIRKVNDLYKFIDQFSPDVILSHDLCYYSVKDTVRYVKSHPDVSLYADTHTSFDNSGRNYLSLHILHGIIYKNWVQSALPYLKKYLYVGEKEREFNIKVYDVPESMLEFYPLGGFIPSDEEYEQYRQEKRNELQVFEEELLFIHSGKLSKGKKTRELVKAFSCVDDLLARLIILGSLPEEDKDELNELFSTDKRIQYLGWKSGDELRKYLCAADLYCQPGSVSATLQNAITCSCPIMSYPHVAYKVFDIGNFMWCTGVDDMIQSFQNIKRKIVNLEAMRESSKRCAEEYLDYRKLAARLYQ